MLCFIQIPSHPFGGEGMGLYQSVTCSGRTRYIALVLLRNTLTLPKIIITLLGQGLIDEPYFFDTFICG